MGALCFPALWGGLPTTSPAPPEPDALVCSVVNDIGAPRELSLVCSKLRCKLAAGGALRVFALGQVIVHVEAFVTEEDFAACTRALIRGSEACQSCQV